MIRPIRRLSHVSVIRSGAITGHGSHFSLCDVVGSDQPLGTVPPKVDHHIHRGHGDTIMNVRQCHDPRLYQYHGRSVGRVVFGNVVG